MYTVPFADNFLWQKSSVLFMQKSVYVYNGLMAYAMLMVDTIRM